MTARKTFQSMCEEGEGQEAIGRVTRIYRGFQNAEGQEAIGRGREVGEVKSEGRGGFRDLRVWQRAKVLAVAVYKLTEEGKLAKDFGLRDQMQRAAVSICSNIAEGDERGSDRDSVRFFYIAKGSPAELITQLEIARDIEFIRDQQLQPLEDECIQIGNMLGALIKARS